MRTCALVKVRASPTAHNSPHSIRKTCTGWVKKIICTFSVFILLYESLLFISSFSLSNLLRFYLICKCNKVNAHWSLVHFKLQHWQHPTITPMKNKNCNFLVKYNRFSGKQWSHTLSHNVHILLQVTNNAENTFSSVYSQTGLKNVATQVRLWVHVVHFNTALCTSTLDVMWNVCSKVFACVCPLCHAYTTRAKSTENTQQNKFYEF